MTDAHSCQRWTLSQRSHRAIAYAEVLIGSLILSGLIVASLNVMGTLSLGQNNEVNQSRYSLLAEALLNEALSAEYGSRKTGPISGFVPVDGSVTRVPFRTVDDYHGWESTPPTLRDGTPLPEFEGITQRVTVNRITGPNGTPTTTETGYKRIVVTIERDGVVLQQRQGIRTHYP